MKKNEHHVTLISIRNLKLHFSSSYRILSVLYCEGANTARSHRLLHHRNTRTASFLLPEQHFIHLFMAVRKADYDDAAPAKRQKTSSANMDPRNNPYLQHMYADESTDSINTNPSTSTSISIGYNTPPRRVNTSVGSGPFAKFQRHKTTAALARSAEDGQTNPFTGQPFSNRYLSILRTRRDLPVHSQR
jgi:hypothetical protein